MSKFKIAAAAMSVALLAWIVWISNPAELARLLAEADKRYIAAALGVSVISMAFRVLKWKCLVGAPFFVLAPVQLFGMTLSNFTPGKMGEPAKALLLKARTGIPVSRSLPSIVWERILDVTVLLSFAALFMFNVPLSGSLAVFSYIGVSLFAAAMLFAASIIAKRSVGERMFSIAGRLPFLKKASNDFVNTFYSVSFSRSSLLQSFASTAVPWALDALVLWLALAALHQNVSYVMLMGVVAISTIIGVASSLPGGIGSMETVASLLLSSLGVPAATAIASVFLFRAATFWFGSAVGALSFLYLSRRLDVRAAMK
ncbi:MAG: flippase-like domain-containing protein [Candidatus Aenigmarchaeota archaeon]|nr:flippase-like domain-containing protein [Candidatus Aenigmarchaeota archaeon]